MHIQTDARFQIVKKKLPDELLVELKLWKEQAQKEALRVTVEAYTQVIG
jgi:hypothetical protein